MLNPPVADCQGYPHRFRPSLLQFVLAKYPTILMLYLPVKGNEPLGCLSGLANAYQS